MTRLSSRTSPPELLYGHRVPVSMNIPVCTSIIIPVLPQLRIDRRTGESDPAVAAAAFWAGAATSGAGRVGVAARRW